MINDVNMRVMSFWTLIWDSFVSWSRLFLGQMLRLKDRETRKSRKCGTISSRHEFGLQKKHVIANFLKWWILEKRYTKPFVANSLTFTSVFAWLCRGALLNVGFVKILLTIKVTLSSYMLYYMSFLWSTNFGFQQICVTHVLISKWMKALKLDTETS